MERVIQEISNGSDELTAFVRVFGPEKPWPRLLQYSVLVRQTRERSAQSGGRVS